MHVVLDARYLARRQSGVGAYTQRLITGLATIDAANRYTCLIAAEGPGLPVRQANFAATSGSSRISRSGCARSARTSTTGQPSSSRT